MNLQRLTSQFWRPNLTSRPISKQAALSKQLHPRKPTQLRRRENKRKRRRRKRRRRKRKKEKGKGGATRAGTILLKTVEAKQDQV